jgi:hypothetical protein
VNEKKGDYPMGQSVSNLDQKHHQLEEAILEEEQNAYPDQFKINELKRQKLRIKDELARTSA